MILVGIFKTHPVYGCFAVSGMILGATYMLWMYQQVMFGPVDKVENEDIPDLNRREIAILVPIAVLVFVMGIFPGFFMRKMDASVVNFISQYNTQYELYVGDTGGKNKNILAINNEDLTASQEQPVSH